MTSYGNILNILGQNKVVMNVKFTYQCLINQNESSNEDFTFYVVQHLGDCKQQTGTYTCRGATDAAAGAGQKGASAFAHVEMEDIFDFNQNFYVDKANVIQKKICKFKLKHGKTKEMIDTFYLDLASLVENRAKMVNLNFIDDV